MELIIDLLQGLFFTVFGFLLSVVERRIGRSRERKPLRQLLNFGDDDLLFFYPHRDELKEAILPRTSTEDFLAINNVMSALIKLDWQNHIGVRDTNHVDADDRRRNVVLICSPKSNHWSRKFQEELKARRCRFYAFERDKETGEWYITLWLMRPTGNYVSTGKYESASYKQEEEYLEAGAQRHDLFTKSFQDYAVIVKTTNPWHESRNKVIMVAGIRGIGTWAAAESIKKKWRQIHAKLPKDKKDADFSALLRVDYDNCDITHIEVLEVELMDH